MTKGLLSKLPLQTLLFIFFCLFVAFSLILKSDFAEFVILAVLLVTAFALAVLKNPFAAIFLVSALGMIFVNLNNLSILANFAESGCRDVKIISIGKKFKTQFVYKVQADRKFLIARDKDDLKISDRAKICISGKVALEKNDQNYLLSHYKTDALYGAGNMEIISSGNSLNRKIYNLSERFRQTINSIYSGDSASLAYGLIFGSNTEFSQGVKENLRRSGTSHLVAVSGYNVSIITAWLFSSLRYISKNFAGIFSLLTLIFFYLITGGSASLLRAAIMGSLILISRFVGRKVLPIHLIFLAASFILILNPYAIYDVGFQLSFFATSGLFFLAEPLEKLISFGRFKSFIIKIFSETLSAQIFVLPILVGNFGQFSLIAPISNILILPPINHQKIPLANE
jgi:ComEC/Rec2-related protein